MTTFGELRSHLQGEPTAKRWTIACAALDGFPEDALDDQIIPYVNGAAKRWPDALRVAPESWVRRTLDGAHLAFWPVVRAIDLSYNYLDAREVLRLLNSERLAEVTILNLDSNRIGPKGCEALARAPGLSRLRELRLSFNGIGDGGLQTLCGARDFPQLDVLDLENNDLRTCKGMPKASFLGGLTELSLAHNHISGRWLAALLTTPSAPTWRRIDLAHTRVNDLAIDALCGRDDLELESLDLSCSAVTSAGVTMIAQWVGAATLKNLRLESLNIGDAALMALADSGHLTELETLNVSRTDVTAEALIRVASSGALPRLKKLRARRLGVPVEGLQVASTWQALLSALGEGASVTI